MSKSTYIKRGHASSSEEVQLPFVVDLVVVDPIPGDGGGQHLIWDGETLDQVESLGCEVSTQSVKLGCYLEVELYNFVNMVLFVMDDLSVAVLTGATAVKKLKENNQKHWV